MTKSVPAVVFQIVLFLSMPASLQAAGTVHHELTVQLRPKVSILKISDTVSLPVELIKERKVQFALHADLIIDGASSRVRKLKTGDGPVASGNSVPVMQYEISLPAGKNTFTISYHGKIHHTIASPEEASARSFSDSPGLIDEQGVFLAASSHWYPDFANQLLSFKMTVALPGGWDAVSQGIRSEHIRKRRHSLVTWEEINPQDDMYLIAGKFTEYQQPAGAVTAQVFLRSKDAALAEKYLEATAQYLSMYEKMLGPYPYKKFALVENFWETGFGMPSFTLLGSKVIRFPFIIVSSYPHELLHNWWGNGVYVDYATGNWAEGLTQYLADHLLKEQRGQGSDHRRDSLQNYADYVSSGRDFSLTEFVSRHSSATEAVGYGKTGMLFHMLRRDMGDEVFIQALGRFYQAYKFKRAGFNDLQRVFSEVANKDYQGFFTQWVQRTGAPVLRLNSAAASPEAGQFKLRLELAQLQEDSAYNLQVPIAVSLEGHDQALQTQLTLDKKVQVIELNVPARPSAVHIDPEYDVFRRLHSAEIPAALSQGFGAEKAVAVLPAKATVNTRNAFLALIRQWQAELHIDFQVLSDTELDKLPDAEAVWVLGWDNKFFPELSGTMDSQQVTLRSGAVDLQGETYLRPEHQLVLAARHQNNAGHTVLWLGADTEQAIANLARKLPHYRKYSYLAFRGDQAENLTKGQWRITDSPMFALVQQQDGAQAGAGGFQLQPRPALAPLPVVFSTQRLRQDVDFLAHGDREGRGVGTEGLRQAGDYIADVFAANGLKPGGDQGSYFQSWSEDLGAPVGEVPLRNVIGILPGSNPDFAGESVVVSAHYDHLGRNFPGSRKNDIGKIHPGADDNASGVAVMLEYLRAAAGKLNPQRTVVFIAFTAEEWDRAGSRYYLQHPGSYPVDKIMAVINLDTVGRLGKRPVTVFGTGSASEWVHIFRGAGFVTGVAVNPVANDQGFSDQSSFYERGVPGVQLFGTVHEDFHRPGDTVNKIDYDGMVKVSLLLKEAVAYLSQRPQPLTLTLPEKTPPGSAAPEKVKAQSGKISLGTVPDYEWQGEGVRISGVSDDSPALQAGLQAADIIMAIDGKPVKGLREFAQMLRSFKAGDTVVIQYKRGDVLQETAAVLSQR